MTTNLNLQDLYFGTVAVKLAAARDLHCRFADRLHVEPAISALLAVIEGYARELQQQMQNMGLTERCRLCGSGPAGGCCSLEITEDSDAVLLLANMLVGCQVTALRRDGSVCSFLGQQGCSLRLKPIFCLNYNCRNIRTGSSAVDLLILEKATGRLLTAQARLEEILLDCLQRGGRALCSNADAVSGGHGDSPWIGKPATSIPRKVPRR